MSTFEFVSVLMSIVVGLGITRILSGFASLIEYRAEVKFDGITLVWALNTLGFLLIYWWVVVNNWRVRETWSFAGFQELFLYGVALYFCAALILPRQATGGLDLRARFERIRVPFFLCWLIVMLLDVLDSFVKGVDYVFVELGPPYVLMVVASVVLALIAIRVSNRKYLLAYGVGTYLVFTVWVLSRFSEIGSAIGR